MQRGTPPLSVSIEGAFFISVTGRAELSFWRQLNSEAKMDRERSYLSESKRFPLLAALAAQAESCVSTGSADLLTSECRIAFDNLLNSNELSTIVVDSLKSAAAGGISHPVWLSKTAEEWVVADTKDYSLRLVAQKPRRNPLLHSLNFNCLVGNLSGPEYGIDVHGLPPGIPVDEFKAGIKAQPGRKISLSKGQSCELLACSDIPQVQMSMPVLTLTLYPKVYAPIIWYFDKDTMLSVMATASHDSPIRRQAGAVMLQHILQSENVSVDASLQTLSKLTRDESHFVRWTAIQGLCAIDLEFAQPYLLKAGADRHPAVAEAAKRAIALHLN